MTDVFANADSRSYEFHDLALVLEREHEWLYEARFEGVNFVFSTRPEPEASDIIDELLHRAKSIVNHPSRSVIELNDNDES